MLELTGRVTRGVRFEYRKGPKSDFVDRTRPGVRSILLLALLPWVHDRTRRSLGATDPSDTNPRTSPRAPTG
jgi:hypothetical protein